MKRRSQQEPILRPCSDLPAVSYPNLKKESVIMQKRQSVLLLRLSDSGWLASCYFRQRPSDSTGLVSNQLENSNHPGHVSRETITQSTAYFASQLTAFTIPLRPAGVSLARQHWLDFMARVAFGTTISTASFVVAGAPKLA